MVVAIAVCVVSACASPRPQEPATATALSEAPRRAAGTLAAPVGQLPSARPEGPSPAGVLVLQAPDDSEHARAAVERFFTAVVSEDTGGLRDLFTPDAKVADPDRGVEAPALPSWASRFARLDYSLLRDRVVLHPADLRVFRGAAALAAGAVRAGINSTLPAETVLVEVPIATPRVGAVDLFGEEMWFVLKPTANGYRIALLVEQTSRR